MVDRPNILYIFTDQQSAFALGCMGNPDLATPAMDSLAETGRLFVQTYCTQPLCTPSRASMFTGLLPHQCGPTRNGAPIGPQHRGRELAHVLARAGYVCAYGGKWHVPEAEMPEDNDHGFRKICGFDDLRLADTCVSFFRERRAQPFFLVASFDNPHNICEWGRSQCLPWGPIGEPPPPDECPALPANFHVARFEPEIIRIEQRAHWAIYPTVDYTDDDWRRHRWAYYRLVEKVDQQIGIMLDGLRKTGLERETVVIFSSDHGDGHGAHQWNQKSVLYEEAVRVPLIISWKGVTTGGVPDAEHLVSNGLDLFRTVCDYAGVDVPPGLPGLSLRPLAEGRPMSA
jgi:arylsulfatase A-like enzyme